MLESGITYRQETTVQESELASTVNSGGLPVYATPAMINFIENTALNAVQPKLDSGQTTVGLKVNVDHLKPTSVGEPVTCTVHLTKVDDSKLFFDVQVEHKTDLIGQGEHVRYIVDEEEFMKRV